MRRFFAWYRSGEPVDQFVLIMAFLATVGGLVDLIFDNPLLALIGLIEGSALVLFTVEFRKKDVHDRDEHE